MTVLTITVPVEVKYLKVEAQPRYWEDAEVNGQLEDDDNPSIPCRDGDLWAPLIEIETGRIVDWPSGTTAVTHYKVCDAGRYALLKADHSEIIAIEGYVPAIMSPSENGFGDYIIMSIGPDGQIADWVADLSAFQDAARKGGDA